MLSDGSHNYIVKQDIGKHPYWSPIRSGMSRVFRGNLRIRTMMMKDIMNTFEESHSKIYVLSPR